MVQCGYWDVLKQSLGTTDNGNIHQNRKLTDRFPGEPSMSNRDIGTRRQQRPVESTGWRWRQKTPQAKVDNQGESGSCVQCCRKRKEGVQGSGTRLGMNKWPLWAQGPKRSMWKPNHRGWARCEREAKWIHQHTICRQIRCLISLSEEQRKMPSFLLDSQEDKSQLQKRWGEISFSLRF